MRVRIERGVPGSGGCIDACVGIHSVGAQCASVALVRTQRLVCHASEVKSDTITCACLHTDECNTRHGAHETLRAAVCFLLGRGG